MTSDNSFAPFTDRLSRDIRNDLSRSFVAALEQESIEAVQSTARQYFGQQLTAGCRDYIKKRLEHYSRILEVPPAKREDPLGLAFLLWDEGLHFEVHEVLEPLWLHARGEDKLLLQALIRAAGVYIKYEAGYPEVAARIAAKALPVLKRNRDTLERYIDADIFIASLIRPAFPPPKLTKPDKL